MNQHPGQYGEDEKGLQFINLNRNDLTVDQIKMLISEVRSRDRFLFIDVQSEEFMVARSGSSFPFYLLYPASVLCRDLRALRPDDMAGIPCEQSLAVVPTPLLDRSLNRFVLLLLIISYGLFLPGLFCLFACLGPTLKWFPSFDRIAAVRARELCGRCEAGLQETNQYAVFLDFIFIHWIELVQAKQQRRRSRY